MAASAVWRSTGGGTPGPNGHGGVGEGWCSGRVGVYRRRGTSIDYLAAAEDTVSASDIRVHCQPINFVEIIAKFVYVLTFCSRA